MKLLLRFLLIIVGLSSTAIGQTATYRVSVGRFTVGQQTVKQTCIGDTVKIEVNSEVKVYLGFTNKVVYSQRSTYYKGYLLNSVVTVKRNGELQNPVER